MDQKVKDAMMEFVDPGSSVPLEKILEAFAVMANETARASFHITRNVKTKKWRVHFSGQHMAFIGPDLRPLIMEAGQFIFDKRKLELGKYVLQSDKS